MLLSPIRIYLSVILLALALIAPLPDVTRLPNTAVATEARLGTTFSPYEAERRGLDYREAFDRLLAADELQIIRLGTYWSEVEAHGWDRLDWLVERAVAADKQVILVVGAKSPRWPEFWAPLTMTAGAMPWATIDEEAPQLRRGAIGFVAEAVLRYIDTPGLLAWQVENEPLDPAGPHMWSLSSELLAAEVAVVRELDPERPIILTFYLPVAMSCDLAHLGDCGMLFAGLFPTSGDRLLDLLRPGDILGVDVYTAIGSSAAGSDWEQTLAPWLQRAAAHDVRLWVTEAQAEPWPTKTSGTRNAQIVTVTRAERLLDKLEGMGIETVLLWGSEHWLSIEPHDASWSQRFLR